MTTIFKTPNSSKRKTWKKKPGWQKTKAEHDAWKKRNGLNGKVSREFKPLQVKVNPLYRRSEEPSLPFTAQPALVKGRVKYEGEMAEREAIAQLEIEEKKKRVAPLCNKGGLVYAEGYDPKTLGRKV